MRHPLLSGLLLLLISSTFNNVYAAGKHWPIEVFDVMDNQSLVIFLGNEDISKSPEWKPSSGEPPLTIAGVLKYAQTWMAKDASLAKAEIHEIELKHITDYEKQNHWYYLLQLKSVTDHKTTMNYIAVLFNGKVYPAIVKPSALK